MVQERIEVLHRSLFTHKLVGLDREPLVVLRLKNASNCLC